MKHKLLLISFLFLSLQHSFSQSYDPRVNFDSLSHLSYISLHDTYLNDVWGHVDQFGNEYALVGARKGVSIVDVTNPQNPSEIFWIGGDESVWRDVNTWNNFAFVTTEAESGLLIMDLNSLPNASGITTTYYQGPAGNEWQSAHTIYVDSAGYAYVFGSNRGNGGVIILDIHTDPMNPIEIGTFDEWYAHDGYVLGDTMYLAHIYDGFVSIVDISDRSNPILLGTKITPNSFAHNIWTSPDGNYGFTTDEVSGAFVASYDITDPTNMIELDKIQSSPGKGVIPHNVQYLNGYLVVSYYADGVVVFDANRPGNLVQVGNFDTYPQKTIGFDGCWASYPYLPSGNILAADISDGLFIAAPNYQRASYLEGNITNESNSQAISNVEISFTTNDHIEFSRTNGDYATGILGQGNFEVTFFKVGFYPQTITVNLNPGLVTNLDVELVPIPQFPYKIIVKNSKTNEEILDAIVNLKGTLTENQVQTNGLGEANFSLFYEEEYKVTVGKWGFKTQCLEKNIINNNETYTVYLDLGYYDDFTFDFGWNTAYIDATKGFWVREKPNATSINSAPGFDSENDCGNMAFVTGNDPNLNPDFDEVKSGTVLLYSPIFDLTQTSTPFIHYERWFYNFYGDEPYDDSLKIYISNGDSTILLDYQNSDESTFYKWNKKSFYLPNYIVPSENMQIIVKLSDFDSNINLTEGGIDNFFIDSIDHFKIDEILFEGQFKVLPNPFTNELRIYNAKLSSIIYIYDLQGNILLNQAITDANSVYQLENLSAGIYFIKIDDIIQKIIKN